MMLLRRPLLVSSWLLICYAYQLPLEALQQPEARPAASSPSLGPLPWSDINVIHTTDTHGWLRGHLGHNEPEPNSSGDLGDLASFVSHIKRQAAQKNVDFFLFDSGDLHDGNGLTDWDPQIRGQTATKLMASLPFDALTVGNHELYNFTLALDTHLRLVPLLGDRFLASNVYIKLPDSNEEVLLGKPYKRWTSRQGRNMLAFGTLFDFTYAAKGIRIQFMKDFVKEKWFLEELQKEVDVVVLLGHIPVGWPEWRLLHSTIRQYMPKTPILILGGHAHVRACEQLDRHSITLASGRYMETVGFLSYKENHSSSLKESLFQRRYLDANRRTYQYHAGNHVKFDMKEGLHLSHELTKIASDWNLSYAFGQSPRNYYLTRHPISHPSSVFYLLLSEIFPRLLSRPDRANPQPLMILNSGSVRFDISSGPFTKDSQSLCFPFINKNLFVPNVPVAVAQAALQSMIEVGEYHSTIKAWHEQRKDFQNLRQLDEEQMHLEEIRDHVLSYQRHLKLINSNKESRSYGYVTKDRCAGLGDDTQHAPLPAYEPPVFVATEIDETAETVDVAWFDFITPMVLDALNRVQHNHVYSQLDVQVYTNITSDTLLETYASRYW